MVIYLPEAPTLLTAKERLMIPELVDSICARIARTTKSFVNTRPGKGFLLLVLIGPLTFLPTIWAAWTASNIDSLRTSTWWMMAIVNSSAFLGVVHNGDWRTRLVMIVWVLEMLAVFTATLVR